VEKSPFVKAMRHSPQAAVKASRKTLLALS
jgi:hypothetical protein